MYNLYNFEPSQDFLSNYRKPARFERLVETTTVFLIFAAGFVWLFV